MEADRAGKPVFVVSRNAKGQWEVLQQGSAKPLAVFDEERDALHYATSLANARQGAIVRLGNGGATAGS